jgi:hypothetical protein
MRASWSVLKSDKELLLFPFFSGLCLIVLFASIWLSDSGFLLLPFQTDHWDSALTYIVAYLYCFCTYFVIIFFNAALIGCALMRIGGENPNLLDGFRIAFSRIPAILEWTLLASSVGFILRLIQIAAHNSKLLVFIARLVEMAWAVASYLVIPVLVIEGSDAIGALSKSKALLRKTWGEQIIHTFSFLLVFIVMAIPGYFLLSLGLVMEIPANVRLFFLIAGVIYIAALIIYDAALTAIFQAALFIYVSEGKTSPGFQTSLLEGAIRRSTSEE